MGSDGEEGYGRNMARTQERGVGGKSLVRWGGEIRDFQLEKKAKEKKIGISLLSLLTKMRSDIKRPMGLAKHTSMRLCRFRI